MSGQFTQLAVAMLHHGRSGCVTTAAPQTPPRPKRKSCALHAVIPLQYRASALARLMHLP